jgi:hypothetical protein
VTTTGTSLILKFDSYLSFLPFGSAEYSLLFIIGLMYLIRVFLALHGEKFSETRIFFMPTIYALFLLVTYYTTSLLEIYFSFALAAIGILLGALLSNKARIFEKKGKIYYKRSLAVSTLWTVLFGVNLLTPLYYPQYYYPAVFSVLLVILTGMIVGQAFRILGKFKKYEKTKKIGDLS